MCFFFLFCFLFIHYFFRTFPSLLAPFYFATTLHHHLTFSSTWIHTLCPFSLAHCNRKLSHRIRAAPYTTVSNTPTPKINRSTDWNADDETKRMVNNNEQQPAHVKACFLGSSLTLPISDGRLALGTWQGIWLCEHRNQAGSRKLIVTLQGCLRTDTSLGSSGGMRNSRSPAHPGADSPLASTSS